jgi:hypothetical protein
MTYGGWIPRPSRTRIEPQGGGQTGFPSPDLWSPNPDRIRRWAQVLFLLDGVTGRLPGLASRVAAPQIDGVINRSQGVPAPSIIEGTTMEHYAGIDVSLES